MHESGITQRLYIREAPCKATVTPEKAALNARKEAPNRRKHGPMNDAIASLALLFAPGSGNAAVLRAQRAARAAGMPLSALMAMRIESAAACLPPGSGDTLAHLNACSRIMRKHAERLGAQVNRAGGILLIPGDAAYPGALTDALSFAAPAVLCVSGSPDLLGAASAAIVGARAVSAAGESLARTCACIFAEAAIGVVSGGAEGVDTAAHQAALAHGGSTIVVLPQGLLTYPVPKWLRAALAQGGAVIVSQFAPDARWQTHAAVTRNATISALARMVCVIEPKKIGGSIRTARAAVAQGKRVLFYCPEAGSQSPALLLRQAGALDLVPHGHPFRPETLLAQWAAAPAPARQIDLFEEGTRECAAVYSQGP
ncbi:MAG: processing protein [Candidatus Hydrogenedentes bacterium]|nr:processing protein [Candidatus Hydrogenedentota bacterium]